MLATEKKHSDDAGESLSFPKNMEKIVANEGFPPWLCGASDTGHYITYITNPNNALLFSGNPSKLPKIYIV